MNIKEIEVFLFMIIILLICNESFPLEKNNTLLPFFIII